MTPERKAEVTAAFHQRFPNLPPATREAISPPTLRQIDRERQMQLLTWWEAIAWADKNPEKK